MSKKSIRPLRLGMVGGGQGALIGSVHRIAARLDGNYQLVAGALSSEAKRAAASAAELGIAPERSYASYEAMAKQEAARPDGIEAVAIVTPNHVHAAPAIAFAKAGIDVICDKPLTDTLANAKKLAAALAKAKVEFVLTHNYTGYPLVRQARAMVAAGELGKLWAVKVHYLQGWLATQLEKQGFKQAVWRTDPKRSGPAGTVGDIGSHSFHLARYVTGLELDELAAELSVAFPSRKLDDHADMLLRWRGGVHGTLSCSQICVGHENEQQLAVYGSKASLHWRQENPNELIFARHGQPAQIITRGSSATGKWAAAATRVPPGHPEGYFEAFAQIYTDAAMRIRARRGLGRKVPRDAAPVPGIEDGMAVAHFIDAAVRSSRQGAKWTKVAS